MNIAIVSSFESYGGAALAAHRLYLGLQDRGAVVTMLVNNKQSDDPAVCRARAGGADLKADETFLWRVFNSLIKNQRSDMSNTRFALPYPGLDLSRCELLAQADVINLHWVSGFLSSESVAGILALNKPVVWTLHDENPFTGGCHFSAGCEKYRVDCRDCPQLLNHHHQLPAHVLQAKRQLWQGNLTLVTPSRWLADNAAQSAVFKGFPVQAIPNSVDINVFKPRDKRETRARLKIDPQSVCILYGAEEDKRKGVAELQRALSRALDNRDVRLLAERGGLRLLSFGDSRWCLQHPSIPASNFGFVDTEEKLADIFAAADFFVLPTLEDNLPNTALESLACGTPVVAYATGGIPDVVQEGINGRLVPRGDVQRLAAVVTDLALQPSHGHEFASACRETILSRFKLLDQASAYLHVFARLAAHGRSTVDYRQLISRYGRSGLTVEAAPITLRPVLEASLAAKKLQKKPRVHKPVAVKNLLDRWAVAIKKRTLRLERRPSGKALLAPVHMLWRAFRSIVHPRPRSPLAANPFLDGIAVAVKKRTLRLERSPLGKAFFSPFHMVWRAARYLFHRLFF